MVPDTFKSTCGFQAIIVVQCVFEGALTLPGNLNIILPPPACFDDHLALRSGTVGHCGTTLLTTSARPLSKCKQASKETDLYLYKNLVAWGRFVQMEFKKQPMYLASINAYTCVRAWTASHFTSFASLIPDAPSSRHHARHCAEQSLQTHRCPVTSGLSEMNLQFILVSHVSLLIRQKSGWNFGGNLQPFKSVVGWGVHWVSPSSRRCTSPSLSLPRASWLCGVDLLLLCKKWEAQSTRCIYYILYIIY